MPSQIVEQPLPGLAPRETPPAPADFTPETTSRLLKTTVVVSNEGEDFEFRIPTTKDEIRVGSLIPRIRRLADPDAASEPMSSIDHGTYFYLRSVALFVACLQSTSAKWVYLPGPDGKPTIDWQEWPADVTNRVLEIALEFQSSVGRFHTRGAAPGVGAGPEAVAGGSDSGVQPVVG